MKFGDEQFKNNPEFQYLDAYRKLSIHCSEIIVKKYKRRIELIEENRKMFREPELGMLFILNKLNDIDEKIRTECSPIDSDTPEIADFKLKILEISKDLDELDDTEEYKKLMNHYNDLNVHDKKIRLLKSTM